MPRPTEPLLSKLKRKMHNWWFVGVGYDWEMNPETGKVWIYKDCTGIVMKAKELYRLEQFLINGGKL